MQFREGGFQFSICDGRFLLPQVDDPLFHVLVLILLMLAAIPAQRRGVTAVAAFPVLHTALSVHQLYVLLQIRLQVKLDAAKGTVHLEEEEGEEEGEEDDDERVGAF